MTYTRGAGPIGAQLMIVSYAPSSNKYVDIDYKRLLTDAGINYSQVWHTYLVKDNDGEVDKWIEELRNEINDVGPNCVLLLGKPTFEAVTKKRPLEKWRGSILHNFGCKMIATYHPSEIMFGEVKGHWNRYIMIFDMKKAKRQSSFKELVLPSRTLAICNSTYQLEQYENRINGNKLSVDIEAQQCIPVCVGISHSAHEAITIPLWKLTEPERTGCWLLLDKILSSNKIIGQNFNYDRDKMCRLGFSFGKITDDTMIKAAVINPELPKNLAFNTSIYTDEPYYKDEGMYEGSFEDLLIGCGRDACVTWEINDKMDNEIDELGMRSYYENFLLPLYHFYSDEIERNGILTNVDIQYELLKKYVEWDEKVEYEMYKLIGDHVNVNSPKQVATLVFGVLGLPQRKGTGEEELTALLNNVVKKEVHRAIIERVLLSRRIKKTINQYVCSQPDFDGRMRTSYFVCLETGRSSTNQQEPPIRPAIEYRDEKNKKKSKVLGMAFQTVTKHGDVGPDCRKMLVPDKGYVFLQADSSQAEARVVALLADDEQMLRAYDEHDIHALTASWFFGGTENDYSKKKLGYESPYRFAGKTLRHAGHLGAGKRRAATELNTQARKYHIDINISEGKADQALKIFHKKCPSIKNVFQAGIINAVQKTRHLIAPIPFGLKVDLGAKRTFYERWGDELFRQAFSYIPQRSVSENIKAAAMRIKKRAPWIMILVEAHDALLVQVPISMTDKAAMILKEEFERPINFSKCSLPRHELIIPCEVEIGMNYYELSKFKFEKVIA